LNNLKVSLQTGTRAEIEEPYLQVNKKRNRGDYEIWRDSVIQSLKQLGTPLSYRQTAKLAYTFPFSRVAFLDWINSAASYESHYTWDRGADIEDKSIVIGNTITNNKTMSLQNTFDLNSLYNKSEFLRKANAKIESNNRRSNTNLRRQDQRTSPKQLCGSINCMA